MAAVWSEDAMKAHEDRLHGQLQALQLLLMAGQWEGSYYRGFNTVAHVDLSIVGMQEPKNHFWDSKRTKG